MAMPLDPVRTKRQEAAISRRGLGVTAAIAEHPGANAQHRRIVSGPGHGAATALERLVATVPVEQRFRQSAIRPGIGLYRVGCPPEVGEASIQLRGVQRRPKRREIDRPLREVSIRIQLSRAAWGFREIFWRIVASAPLFFSTLSKCIGNDWSTGILRTVRAASEAPSTAAGSDCW